MLDVPFPECDLQQRNKTVKQVELDWTSVQQPQYLSSG